MEEIQGKLKDLKERFSKISEQIDRDKLRTEIRELEAETMKEGFWNDRNQSSAISRQLSDKQKTLNTIEDLESRINNALEMAEESSMEEDLKKEIKGLEDLLDKFELKLFLSHPHDESEAILSVHSGAGGVEAMDWASMLVRMYQRYFEKQDWKFEVTDEMAGEEAGIKTVSMIIHEPYAFGYLKGEAGVHRLVRISPFSPKKLRHTSFALVEVMPDLGEEEKLDIKEEDLNWDFYRASSRGGQNVQKVSTAVRLRHKPTGIAVTAQSQRYQAQNREYALKLLKAKLWILKEEERKKEEQKLKGAYKTPGWGNQIRSYVLHPYHMVKDLRTGFETSNTEAVLNGEIDGFIEEELRKL